MQLEHTELDDLIDQRSGTAGELIRIGEHGHQHAGGDGAGSHHVGAIAQQQHTLKSEQTLAEASEHHLHPLQAQLLVRHTDHGIGDLGLSFGLGIGQLDGLHPAQRLDHLGLLACLEHHGVLAEGQQLLEHQLPDQGVHTHEGQHQHCELQLIHRQQQQCQDAGEPIEHGRHETARQRCLHGADRPDLRQDITQVPPFKEVHRQAHQVGEDVHLPLRVHVRADPGEQPAARDIEPGLYADDQRKRRSDDDQ
ncbi:hypothetical protein D3C71_1480310 [compost metagenome]